MSAPIIFITGANTGLGLETVKALCKSSTAYTILLGARSPAKGDAAIQAVRAEQPNTASTLTTVAIDIESDASIQQAYSHIASAHGRLDVLVNNAGGNFDAAHRDGRLTQREAFNASWNLNVAGTQVVTTTFVPLLLPQSPPLASSTRVGPKIVFITSGTSSLAFTDKFDTQAFQAINASPAPGWPKEAQPNPVVAYRSSKTGLNMLVREWRRTLKNDGVKVMVVSPGFLATGLAGLGPEKLRQMGAKEPWEGGELVKDVVEGKRDEDEGKVILAGGVQPW